MKRPRLSSRASRVWGCLVLFIGFSFLVTHPLEKVQAADGGPDLSMVPPDAAGFVTVHFSELWDNPGLKEVRKLVDSFKGDDYLRENVGLRLQEIEWVTLLMPTLPGPQADSPGISIIVTTKKPFSPMKILEALEATSPLDQPMRPDGRDIPIPKFAPPLAKPLALWPLNRREMLNVGRLDKDDEPDLSSVIYYSRTRRTFVYLLGERTVMFAEADSKRDLNLATHLGLLLRKGKNGKLTSALATAASGKHHVVGGFDLTQLNRVYGKELPATFPGIDLLQADSVTLKLDADNEMQFSLSVDSRDSKTSKQVEESINSLLELASTSLPAIRKEFGRQEDNKAMLLLLDQVEVALKGTTVKNADKSVAISFSMKGADLLSGIIAQSVVEARKSAERSTLMNNFKQLGLAAHNFESAYGYLPFPGYDKKGEIARKFDDAKLSWRVALLPYIEQENLYRQFKLNEPWDSENNKKLIPLMPKIYSARTDVKLKEGHTFVQIFQGPDALPTRASIVAISDGSSNTFMMVEAGEGVIWTKPDDLKFDVNKDLPKLGGNFNGNFIVAMCDGSVRFVDRKKVSDKTLKLLIQPADGNVISGDWE